MIFTIHIASLFQNIKIDAYSFIVLNYLIVSVCQKFYKSQTLSLTDKQFISRQGLFALKLWFMLRAHG